MKYKRYTMLQKWVNNEPQDEYRQGSLIDQTEYDTMSECNEGNQNPDIDIEGKIYEWRQTSSVMCYNYSKYSVEEKYVSNDNGATFVQTGETRRGVLIETNSAECGYIEPQTRWTTVQDEYVCQGADKYTKEVQEVSYDGGETWNTNGQERGGTLIERNSIDCGWIPSPQFRWVDDGYECVGYDKYAQEKEQVSLDAGETWSDTGETRLGQLIEYNSSDCGYVPPTPEPEDYLTFTALENGYFRFTGNDLQYSIDDGENWSTLTSGTDSPTVRANSRILWKATGLTPNSNNGIGSFSSSGRFDVSGNIMSLYYGDDFASQTDLTGKNYAFNRLFYNCSNLVSAENLVLPATTLSNSCYKYMFYGCTSLTTAPELPSTTLASSCYEDMFKGCTSLTTAPTLPATTLTTWCYQEMFNGCTNLNYVKAMFTTNPNVSDTIVSWNRRYTDSWLSGVASSGTFVKNVNATWTLTGSSGIPSGWTVETASN